MNDPEISVIVPYYNENFEIFKVCIDSIIDQNFKDFEVIIVDDGSKPENAKQLSKIEISDPRITVISQNNQGVSAARNKGTEIARGKYIVYVDADDLLPPYFFEEAYKIAEEKQTDILYGFLHKTVNENDIPSKDEHPKIISADRDWLMKYTLAYLYQNGEKRFGRGPIARLIRSDLAKSTKFPVGVPLGEDVLWNIEIMNKAASYYLVDQVWYIYIFREQSATSKFDPEIEKRVLPFYNEIQKHPITGTNNDYYFYKRIYRDLYKYIFLNYLGHKQNKDPFLEKQKKFSEICKKYPWNKLSEKEFFAMSDTGTKFKIIFFRLNLTYAYWMINKKIRKSDL